MPDSANNVTAIQHPPQGYLSDPFDKTKVWDEQCSPLVQQVFDICKEHDIPFHLTALHAFERMEHGTGVEANMARAVHFPGPHRVPHQMAVVRKLFDDPDYCAFIIQMSSQYAAQQFGDDGEQED